jgi:hypothetical protein
MIKKTRFGREKEYLKAIKLRKLGYGYKTISKEIKINSNTIRNWVSYIKIDWKIAYKKSDKQPIHKKTLEDFTTNRGRKNVLIKERGRMCEECKLTKWLNNLIPLEIHHKDGNKSNNTNDNLSLICPNCHTFTPTYKSKNIRPHVEMVDKVDLKSTVARRDSPNLSVATKSI